MFRYVIIHATYYIVAERIIGVAVLVGLKMSSLLHLSNENSIFRISRERLLSYVLLLLITKVVDVCTANNILLLLLHTGVQYDVEHSHVCIVFYMLHTT
jgi:hypothetical protein